MLSNAYYYIYLHGFASAPTSAKAVFIKDKFKQCGIDLDIPDLNQDDFANLTLSRTITFITERINKHNRPTIIFGSSLGGLSSAIISENLENIEKMVLLAPAFNIRNHFNKTISEIDIDKWKNQGKIEVYHYGANKNLELNYQFWDDLNKHDDRNFNKQIPTLIIHGVNDQVIPIQSSYDYLERNRLAHLIEFEDGHSLDSDLEALWDNIAEFCIRN